MEKAKTNVLALVFAGLLCVCSLLAIGFSPDEHEHLPLLFYVMLPFALPALLLLLIFVRKEVQEVPEKSVVHVVWTWTFFLFSTGTIIWLLMGSIVIEMGHYHCEFESGFMTDNDVTVPYVNRSVGILLLILFSLGWIVLSQKSSCRNTKANFILLFILTIATICLGLFLFYQPDVECIVYGG